MNLEQVLELYDAQERRDIGYPQMERQVSGSIVRFIGPRPGNCFITYSKLDESTVDAAIRDQIAYFRGRQPSFEWKAYVHDRPADLAARLAAHGFETDEDDDAIMALDLSEAPDWLLGPVDQDVRRLTDPAQLADVKHVLETVYGRDFDWIDNWLGSLMQEPGYLSVYSAYVGDDPAAVGWTFFSSPSFASMWGGATKEHYRGRGLYTALVKVRIREVVERGRPYVTVDAGEMSRPLLARKGFQLLTWAADYRYTYADQNSE